MSAEYWPAAKGSCETYGKTLTTQKNTNDYIIRKMDISESQSGMSVSQSGFSVTHIQYLRWMEDSVPMITSPAARCRWGLVTNPLWSCASMYIINDATSHV